MKCPPLRGSWDPATSNTFYAALLSSIVGLLLFRRLGSFPGVTSFGQVVPSVAGPYLGALVTILALRLEYSRPLLFLSAILAAILFYSLWVYCRRRCAPTICLLPGTEFSSPHSAIVPAGLRAHPRSLGSNPIVVADLHSDLTPEWESYILNSVLSGVPVYHAKQLQESLSGRVEIAHLSENSFGSLIPNQLYLRTKRGVDLAICLVLLPFLAIAFLAISLVIKADSKGSVFFLQERMGFRGQTFNVVKFRTMHESSTIPVARDNARTQDNDPRVTRVGRYLRRFRLDELPQAINVLRGEMSWIGPRPEACALADWYHEEIPFYGYRHMVRPGITGWAQVHQGHVHDVDAVRRKLQYDFYYIKYFSAWLDCLIVLRTFRTLIFGNGAR